MSHTPIVGPAQHSEAWHQLRKFNPDRRDRPVVFGASEAAAACNQCPYESALSLYLKKRGEMESEFSASSKFRMAVGTHLEPLILDHYADQQDCILERSQPMFFHPIWSFMGASLDAIARPRDRDRNESWAVDAKSTNWRMRDKTGQDTGKFGDEGTDQLPVNYIFQGQIQMAVMGLDRCDFAVSIDNSEPLVYTVTRNDDLIKQIALAEAELAERIIAGDPPEPNFEHSGTKQVLQRMFGTDFGKVAELSEEEHDLWIRKEQLSAHKKIIDEELDEISARITWAMQDAEIGRFPDAAIELKKTIVKESVVKEYTRKSYSFFKARKIG